MKDVFLAKRLEERRQQNAYRRLRLPDEKADFCSNDYLGIVTNNRLQAASPASFRSGSTGSRLLAGNYALIEETEAEIARFHEAEAGLIFNSGYDANSGLLSSIARKGDTILYDALSHASLRDGIRLSFARSWPFRHNDPEDLEKKLQRASGNTTGACFVVTESVFSMDGDQAPLPEIARLCESYQAHLIVDEAHATGVTGARGEGLVQASGTAHRCFARVHTFGKALGTHGAIVLGSGTLRNYLINFSRPFIYTTALPESSIAAIREAYRVFPGMDRERKDLSQLIRQFQQAELPFEVLKSQTPIQGVIVPGNDAVKKLADSLQAEGLDVRPILYPTVPANTERLRIVLHAFNTAAELTRLIQKIAYF
jgi:8-amino-7-oxononanoate synthase